MLEDSELEAIAATARQIYNKHMTFSEFKTAMDIRHYNTPDFTYKTVFITASEFNDQ